jgi:hypothetical protein
MKKPDGRVVYDVSVTSGVLTVTAGAWIQYGAAAGLATFGGLVIALSVYAAERLSGR